MNLSILCSIMDIFRLIPETFRYAAWSATLGLLLSVAVPVIILAILQRQRPNEELKGRCYVICGLLFLFLLSQLIPLFAAVSFKRQIGKLENHIDELVEQYSASNSANDYDSSTAKEFVSRLDEQYPYIDKIVNVESFENLSPLERSTQVISQADNYLRKVIINTTILSSLGILLSLFLLERTNSYSQRSARSRTSISPRRTSAPTRKARMTRPGNRRRILN